MSRSVEERLARLEETLYFQDDTITQLNEVIADQQRQLDELEKRCAASEDKLRNLMLLLSDDGGEDNGPPPHYL